MGDVCVGPTSHEMPCLGGHRALFWQWGLGKCIRNIGPKHKEVFTSQDCVKETRAGLADTVSVCLVEYFDQP